ncbi:(2Fe-2S)-binding protein [Thiomonas sp. FB-Cd]|uniref:(2Fe-2S)-binding protein n=1 Tax=Thiomonas sp. FB-Cd TaxID=1158292 RepID=UPI0004DFAA6F|nr:(2Fe-2S)-binding protein [Thiomonas sp. FB-Cd]
MQRAGIITVRVNGVAISVPEGASVAAAIERAAGGATAVYRLSVSGAARSAYCGMGVCKECRVTIDGEPNRLACQSPCVAGMQVLTAERADAAL